MSNETNRQVITFGCRLNTVESEQIKNILDEHDINDVIVVNTCAVTAEAERQARQRIRKLKFEHPDKRIIVTGCAATTNTHAYEQMPEVDCVILNEHKNDAQTFANMVTGGANTNSIDESVRISSGSGSTESANIMAGANIRTNSNSAINTNMPSIGRPAPNPLPMYSSKILPRFEGKSRAFLQIQTGCDNFCTFCVTRIARGKSVSFPFSQILKQAQQFVDQGYKEINLTGVNICSYDYDGFTLGRLIDALLKALPEDVRMRLSSLDPSEVDESLFDAMHNKRVLPHWHLSLQSGDATVLARMQRRHTPEDILRVTERIRVVRPELVLGADVIAGFPGETQEMFENTCDLILQCEIALLHVFPYSDRPGTVANTLPQKIPQKVKVARAQQLREIGKKISFSKKKALLGSISDVFVEKEYEGSVALPCPAVNAKKCIHTPNDCEQLNTADVCDYSDVVPHSSGAYIGKTEHFFPIIIQGENVPIGRHIPIKIENVLSDGSLYGVYSIPK